MEDWFEAATETIDDYRIERSKSMINKESGFDSGVDCINENWIRQPPNVLFFAIQRLSYDVKA